MRRVNLARPIERQRERERERETERQRTHFFLKARKTMMQVLYYDHTNDLLFPQSSSAKKGWIQTLNTRIIS